ncbi:MAG: hypothetical protein GY771_17175, partial [bacterium]|nr:hypothetical protein [bacterium]
MKIANATKEILSRKDAAGLLKLADKYMEVYRSNKKMFELPDYKVGVVGMGFEPAAEYDAERFRRTYRIREPFPLYSGRRE